MNLKKVIRRINSVRNGEQNYFEHEKRVNYQLFLPLFLELGWDIHSSHHSSYDIPEVGGKAAKGVFFNRESKPLILFETKGIKDNLNNHIEETKNYFLAGKSVKVAILTNMVEMYFFSDFKTPGVMDETPFYKVHLPSYTQQDLEFLELFRRDYFLDHFDELYAKWKEQYIEMLQLF